MLTPTIAVASRLWINARTDKPNTLKRRNSATAMQTESATQRVTSRPPTSATDPHSYNPGNGWCARELAVNASFMTFCSTTDRPKNSSSELPSIRSPMRGDESTARKRP